MEDCLLLIAFPLLVYAAANNWERWSLIFKAEIAGEFRVRAVIFLNPRFEYIPSAIISIERDWTGLDWTTLSPSFFRKPGGC
jgi:hypothetical protein